MKFFITAFVATFFAFQVSFGQQRGDIISFDLLQEYTADSFGVELQQNIGIPPAILGIDYDFKVYRVVYYTQDINPDSLTIASGLAAIPTNYTCDSLGLMIFGHGLCLKDTEVPSNNQANNAYSLICKGIGANGFVGVAPDYIHMGPLSSPGPQAFIHSRTQATAYIDLMRAARTFCANNNIALSGQVFLSGYSQGGNATMGTAKLIQEEYANEFNVTAACAGGGSFDLSGICADSLTSTNRVTPERQSLPLVIRSLAVVYEDSLAAWGVGINAQNVLDTVFKPAYQAQLPALLDRTNPFFDISFLDSIPARMIIDPILTAFQTDSNHFFRRILADNDVYDWTPQMPLVIFHSDVDIENPYENALFTLQRFQQNGAPNVSLFTIGGLSHPAAGQPYVLYTIGYMKENRKDCLSSGIRNKKFQINDLTIFPNPSSQWVNISTSQKGTLRVLDSNMKLLYTGNIEKTIAIDVSTYAKGNYLVSVENESGSKIYKLLLVQ
jgi:hypothetical protein